MVHNALTGDYNNALKMHRELSTVYKLLSADGNPAGIKALLGIQGKALNRLRLPLVPAREETYKAIEKFVKNFEA